MPQLLRPKPPLRSNFPATKLRGVNLGGWLILERWMTPSVFEGRSAIDEYSLWLELGTAAKRHIGKHHQTYITDEDLRWIADHGLNAVRLPVPHWAYGDVAPYGACIDSVRWLMDAAHKHGLRVLLDLHTAPGSQNGQDHSGRSGAIGWNTSVNRQATLATLQQLAEEFGPHPALLGIELLNEPHISLPLRPLQRFYQQGCRAVQSIASTCQVVASDAFRPSRLDLRSLANITVDMHLYQAFSTRDKQLSLPRHYNKARRTWGRQVANIAAYVPVIVGEWSLGLDPSCMTDLDATTESTALRSFAQAQLDGFAAADGWFFWSYKTEGDNMPGWSFRTAHERGWLTEDMYA